MLLKRIYTAQDRIYLHHLKNVLQTEGIDCVIKNDQLGSVAGEVPLTACWPELWVAPLYAHKAKRIISELTLKEAGLIECPVWVCEECGEKHPAQFTACWKCQAVEVIQSF